MRMRWLNVTLCIFSATTVVSAQAQLIRDFSSVEIDDSKLQKIRSKVSAAKTRSTVPAGQQAATKHIQPTFLNQAQTARENGQYEKALQMYRFLRRSQPRNAAAPAEEAAILWMLNRPIEARACADESLHRDPRNAEAHMLLARIHLSEGDMSSAQIQLKEAIKCAPDHVAARLLLADLLGRTGQHAGSDEHFSKALELAPGNVSARLNVVSQMAVSGKVSDAIKLCQEGIKLDAQNPRLQLELGLLHMQMGQAYEASECFKSARNLDARDSAAHQMLAISSGARNDWKSAVDHAQVLCEFDPDGINATVLSAWCAYASGDVLEAKNRLERAVELLPADASLRNLYAITLADLRRFPQAREQLEKGSQLEPSNQEIQLNLAMLELMTGKLADALARSTAIVEAHVDSTAPYSLSAYANLLSGKNTEAQILAKKALSKDPSDPLARVVIARILRNENELDQALKHLREISLSARGSAFIQCELAETLFQNGEYQKAAEAAQFALQLSSANQQAKAILAHSLSKQGNWDGALLYLRELSGRNPKDLAAKIELAEALISQGDYDAANTAYEAAQRIDPRSSEPLKGMAKIAILQGNIRLARKLEARLHAVQH